MKTQLRLTNRSRRGATLVLAAFLMVMLLGMVAFAVDCGYMVLVRSQLQGAADSAAMAAAGVMGSSASNPVTTAQQFAGYHTAGGRTVDIATSDIEYGVWDSSSLTFTPTSSVSNALRITARMDAGHGGGQAPLFFGPIFGRTGFDAKANAIAMGNPRDICFVVDLSGSMNDDTTTGYGSSPSYRSPEYDTVYSSMMGQMFSDFGFGSYPGTTQTVGQQVGATSWNNLISASGPLSHNSFTYGGQTYTISSTYKILGSDSSSTRQTKAYKWIIDNQLSGTFACLSAAKPTPNSSNSASYNYWSSYIANMVSNSGVLGYRTYTTWLQNAGGRDQLVDGSQYGQLSVSSPNCPYHNESTAGGSFSFPPSEYPTHAERRSVIAGLQQVKTKNSSSSDSNQNDWVSIVTFDKVAGTVVRLGLTSNYDSAMQSCTTMQAVGNNGNSTATETGLIAAYNLIKPQSQGGTGREHTQKIVVLLTDGIANLKSSSNTTISNYITANPSSNYYGGSSDYPSDAAMMQVDTMRAGKWQVFALALGIAADYDFMDRMARMGGTADDNGHAPTTSGDPSNYETEMTALLEKIINNPQVHLVQ